MESSGKQLFPPPGTEGPKKAARLDILIDLVDRGNARGVIEPSDLWEVLSHPLIVPYFQGSKDRVMGFIRDLAMRGIEVLEKDIDKGRYTGVPMVIVVDSPIWDSFNRNSVIGRKFHFPNRYRDMVLPGRPFVYFRCTSLKAGERVEGGYFGCGILGDMFPDPSTPKLVPTRRGAKWYANIRDYRPFEFPVPWKDGEHFLEDIEDHEWTDLVRDISVDTYMRILELERSSDSKPEAVLFGGVDPAQVDDLLSFNKLMEECGIGEIEVNPHSVETLLMPGMEEVVPIAVDSSTLMMTVRTYPAVPSKDSRVPAESPKAHYRRSKHSVVVGLRAEEVVFRVLQGEAEAKGYQSVRWVSTEGEKPGWDIEVVDAQGTIHSIEVKGASGRVFPSIELTAGEWQAAESRRGRFWLFLVTECIGKNPKIQRIKDPVSLVHNGTLSLSPLIWKLELTPSDGPENQEPEPEMCLE
jgi:hypothetical protein